MKKIIITGGLGYLGSNIAKRLIKEGFEVIILDNFLSNTCNKVLRSKIIKCDITNYDKLKKIKQKNIYAVLHLAAQSSGPKSIENPDLDVKLNILGTVNVLKFCKENKIKKFIFASSFTVYGDPKSSVMLKESDECRPKSLYGISKYTCEQYIKILCKKYSINWIILRMFNVYGPGQDLNRKDQGIVSIYLSYIKDGNYLPVKGSLKRFRDLIYLDDVVSAWIICLKKNKIKNQIFNLGSGKKTYIGDLINEIIKIYDKKGKVRIKQIEPTHGDIKGCYANISLIKKKLNFYPKFSLKRGLDLFKSWADKK